VAASVVTGLLFDCVFCGTRDGSESGENVAGYTPGNDMLRVITTRNAALPPSASCSITERPS
jgi:hypothetical protein